MTRAAVIARRCLSTGGLPSGRGSLRGYASRVAASAKTIVKCTCENALKSRWLRGEARRPSTPKQEYGRSRRQHTQRAGDDEPDPHDGLVPRADQRLVEEDDPRRHVIAH